MPDLLGPWRPEGWDDAVNSLHQKWQGLGIISADAAKYPAMLLVVEDVATAMLEALKAGGVRFDCSRCEALEDCALSLSERGHGEAMNRPARRYEARAKRKKGDRNRKKRRR